MLYDPLKHPSLPEVSPKFNQKFIEAVDAGARRIYKKHLTGQDIIGKATESKLCEISFILTYT